MKIVSLGPPGIGEGTQAKSISNRYSIPHVFTGDIFRKNVSESTPLDIGAKKHIGKGQLISDEVTINTVKDRLQQDDCKNGYLSDRFPRTVNQAEVLQEFLSEGNGNLNTALLTEVPTGFILEKIVGKRVCPSCGASHRIKFNPPTIAGKCDVCGSDIIQRKGGTEETISERLDVYKRQTQPLVDFCKERSLLSTVDGAGAINEVFEGIYSILGSVEQWWSLKTTRELT